MWIFFCVAALITHVNAHRKHGNGKGKSKNYITVRKKNNNKVRQTMNKKIQLRWRHSSYFSFRIFFSVTPTRALHLITPTLRLSEEFIQTRRFHGSDFTYLSILTIFVINSTFARRKFLYYKKTSLVFMKDELKLIIYLCVHPFLCNL